METAVRIDSGSIPLAFLGRTYGQVGRKSDAQKVLQQLLERSKTRYVPAYCLAWVYEGLGDFKQANIYMDQAIKDREPQLVYIKVEADDLNRANPYFPEWLKKIGLDNIESNGTGTQH